MTGLTKIANTKTELVSIASRKNRTLEKLTFIWKIDKSLFGS